MCKGTVETNRPLASRSRTARPIGLLPVPHTIDDIQVAIWNYPRASAVRKYSESRIGNLCQIDAELADIDIAIRWLIDPDRGWNPVRVQYIYRGEVLNEAISDFEKHGDVWFPKSVATSTVPVMSLRRSRCSLRRSDTRLAG